MNKKGFVLSTYVYILLVFFLLLLGTMLAVLNNSKLLSNKLKEQSGSTSGLLDNEYSFILLGDKEIVVFKDTKYQDPGYIAKTTKGVDISTYVSVIGNVDTSVTNEYTLTYKITYNGVSRVLKRTVNVIQRATSYIIKLLKDEDTLHNGLVQTTVEYNGTQYNAGIRYVGTADEVKNQVYFNCEPTDGTNTYGSENYKYASSCEIWRIIGVFEVKDESGDTTQRLKLINTNSTFVASWDSSASGINSGWGVNQWGPSGAYEGADLMQLLNGHYIEKNNSNIPTANKKECKYNNGLRQSGLAQTCDTTDTPLSSFNMKPLTTVALNMIKNAVWDTYAVEWPTSVNTNFEYAPEAYLQEKGISNQYTGCLDTKTTVCTEDNVTRNNEWTGLVGLMSASDIMYANGWLYNGTIYPWSISPDSSSTVASYVWCSDSSGAYDGMAGDANGVWPTLYLDSNVQIIGGNGDTTPYKLKI